MITRKPWWHRASGLRHQFLVGGCSGSGEEFAEGFGEGVGYFHLGAVSAAGEDYAVRGRDSRLDRAAVGVDIRVVELSGEDESRHRDLVQPGESCGFRFGRAVGVNIEIVRIGGEQGSEALVGRLIGGRDVPGGGVAPEFDALARCVGQDS